MFKDSVTMNKIKFSIIVPVYNAEKYVVDTIESVLRQDYDNWQLILVNDGSTDSSGNICSDYADKDKRIIYINQENQGLPGARNSGYFKADGDYILFCDADDCYTDNALSVLVDNINSQDNPDLLVFGFLMGDHKWPVIHGGYPKNKKLDNNYIFNNILPEQLNLHPRKDDKYIAVFVWCKAYKHSYLKENNILHDPHYRKWEDKLFILQALKAADSIVFLDEALYHYRTVNDDHLAKKYHPDTMLYVISSFKQNVQLFKGKFDLYSDYSKRYYFDVISKLIIEALKNDSGNALPNIYKVLDSDVMKNWTSGISPKSKNEKLIKEAILNSDYSNIQSLYLKYSVELDKKQRAAQRKQRSIFRRAYRKAMSILKK